MSLQPFDFCAKSKPNDSSVLQIGINMYRKYLDLSKIKALSEWCVSKQVSEYLYLNFQCVLFTVLILRVCL